MNKPKDKVITVKAVCNYIHDDEGLNESHEKRLKIDLMGTMQNPYFCVFPNNQEGKQHAYGNCNGYEEVRDCIITILPRRNHKCNCEFCNKRNHPTKRKQLRQ